MQFFKSLVFLCLLSFLMTCKNKEKSQVILSDSIAKTKVATNVNPEFNPSDEFKSYWYAGEAEISSYELEQARYGALRNGKSVLIFVTEDFLPNKQVKADQYSAKNTSVLKLNMTKNFITGIYPYSIMQSTFYPIANNKHALKITCSIQEWCGQVYSQLNNKDIFEVVSHSYFEAEADQDFKLDKTHLENDIWTQLRIDPSTLPTGAIEMIPSFEYVRLKHIELKAYNAEAVLSENAYTITYPELERTLTINFNPDFPYNISGWEETYKDGYGLNAAVLTTKAKKLNTIKSAYWTKNSISDEVLRETLKLN